MKKKFKKINNNNFEYAHQISAKTLYKEKEIYPKMTNRYTSTSKDWLKSLLSRKRKRVKKKEKRTV